MRRVATVILVLLVVLGVGFVVADRFVVARTEDRLLTEAGEWADLAEGSDVEIDGFPFLTQVAAGRLAEVRGTAPGMVLEGLELEDVRVAVRGVAPQEPYPAETVEINAGIPASTVQSVLGSELPMQDAPHLEAVDGLLQFSVQVLDIEFSVRVEPEIVDGEVALRLGAVQVGDATVPDEIIGVLDEGLSEVRLEIPGLPEGLEPTRVAVAEDGLQVRLEGSDVELGAWVR